MSTVRKVVEVSRFKALPDVTGMPQGRFEAMVSTFGNVDFQGDRVVKGAFETDLDNWRKSGDPLPLIWSHDWGNPYAHIGSVDPKNIEETDEGLLIKEAQLDIDTNPFAAQVFELLQKRRVKEFSFGYEVIREKRGKDGANELHELRIVEAGPTLKGANPQAQLVGTKAAPLTLEELATTAPVTDEVLAEAAAIENAAAGEKSTSVTLTNASDGVHITVSGVTVPDLGAKAGRVLSAKNEDKLRQGVALITEVLSAVSSDAGETDSTTSSETKSTEVQTAQDGGDTNGATTALKTRLLALGDD